jgi:endonuclease/exonuclease/phosphatase family metal-dependent hydrolase
MDLRLVSYNVKCFPWCATPIKEIVAFLTNISLAADVVALQEVWCRHDAWAAAFTAAGWTFLRPPREHHIAGLFGSGLAFAWRSQRDNAWTLTEARFYPYLSSVGLDTLVVKGWFRVELHRNVAKSHKVRLINTHMQSDYEICDDLWRPIAEPVRMAQAFQLVETERRLTPSVPTLIVGDMNSPHCWFPECEWLTGHAGPTFQSGAQTLDHCATWGGSRCCWRLAEHRVFRAVPSPWSDHWPVLWQLISAERDPSS